MESKTKDDIDVDGISSEDGVTDGEEEINTPSSNKRHLVWRCACGQPGAEWARYGPPATKHIKHGRESGDGQLHQVSLYDADTGEKLASSSPEAQALGLIGKRAKSPAAKGVQGGVRGGDTGIRSPMVGKFIAGTVEMSEIPLVLYRMTKDAVESKIDPNTGQHVVFAPTVGQWIEQCLFIFYTEHAEELGLSEAIVKRITEVSHVGN